MFRIVHVVSSLDLGVADAMLVKLVNEMDQARFSNTSTSFTDHGQLDKLVKSVGVLPTLWVWAPGILLGLRNVCPIAHDDRLSWVANG